MAEAVKVIVRCRPMNGREKGLKCNEVVKIDNRIAQCTITNPNDKKAPSKPFTFDGAYGTDSTTEQIYADIGFSLVEGVTEGYNGTIFAYGQTGCGKSFSMQGITDPATQRGIIPRAFDHIFETIQVSKEVKYLVHAAYLEIYNEDVRDLLGKDVKKKLDLKEHPDRGVYVQGLSMHPCKSVKECAHIMEMGWNNRSTGATAMNADSSRSHSIFTIYMERCDTDDGGEEHIRAAKLNLVDLAGSERQAKTGATGDRLKEATKINLSLSALGNVISALVDGKSKHIPYRDSKLTRLLQDSLGGNTKTLMVACLSPADNNYDETLSTLRYANRAKNIKNKPKINEDPKDALLREYQEEITKLKMMLRGEIPIEIAGDAGGRAAPAAAAHAAKDGHKQQHIEEEKQRIRQEYESEMQAMKQEFEEMKISKEKLEEEMEKIQNSYDSQIAGVEGTEHVASPGQKDGQVVAVGGGEDDYEDDSEYTGERKAQRAVHLATVKTLGEQGVPVAPSSSPTNAQEPIALSAQHEEALRRLKELQQQMVGGELAEDEEVVKHHIERKKHVEERARRLAEELAKMDGDEIMLDIYEDVHDELKVKNKVIEKEKERIDTLQREIVDLQSEFEFDRIDYLETIRRQEQQVKWLESVMEKVHPCLRRDCNYMNLDKIRAQSKWVDEEQKWMMPKMIIEKTKLPTTGIQPGGRQEPIYRQNGDVYDDLRSEDRYLERLQQKEDDYGNKYFKSKRQDKLLQDRDRYSNPRVPSPHMNGHVTNGYGGQPGGYGGQQNGFGGPGSSSFGGSPLGHNRPMATDSMTHDQLRAAQVHGQIQPQDEFLVRKPTRLDALPQPGMKSKKKKNKMNMMEQY